MDEFQIPSASEIKLARANGSSIEYKTEQELQEEREISHELKKIFQNCVKDIILSKTDSVEIYRRNCIICCTYFEKFYMTSKKYHINNEDYDVQVPNDMGEMILNLKTMRPHFFEKIQEKLRSNGYELHYTYDNYGIFPSLIKFKIVE